MKQIRITAILGLALLALPLAAAQDANFSGTWRLDVAKSTWGKHPRLAASTVTIEQHDPAFQYSGTVVFPNSVNSEDRGDKATFVFNGAMDGKEYPVTGTIGAGNISLRRVSSRTILSEFKSSDGKVTETARMTLSPDGKTLIRQVQSRGPDRDASWTEVYNRE